MAHLQGGGATLVGPCAGRARRARLQQIDRAFGREVRRLLCERARERGERVRSQRQAMGKPIHSGISAPSSITSHEAGKRDECYLAFCRGLEVRERLYPQVVARQQQRFAEAEAKARQHGSTAAAEQQ